MAIKNIEFIQIEAVLDSLGLKQIGVEPDVDSELNFRMWGGKDSTGVLTHWLAKNRPGLLHSLRLSSLAGQSQSIAKIDANGNIIRGSSDDVDFPRIQDNAFDPDENPTNPDNITEVQELTFFRNTSTGANYPILASEERTYGILLPAPAAQADQGKVPMYKVGDQIVWESVLNEDDVDYKISSAVQNLQAELTFDTTPAADSTNPVTSGGIKTALDTKQDTFTIVETDASTTGNTATVSIEQGDVYIVDLSEETSLTAIEIVLTNNTEVTFPLWWFKIESGSAATLSVKIGSVAVGWLGSEITNIELGKTIEVSVVDGVACGGELV